MKLDSGKYFGKTLQSLHVSGLVLTEKIHPAGEVLPEHYHENAYFCLTVNGGWNEIAEGISLNFKVNNVVYHPKEEMHKTAFNKNGPSKTFNVEITPAWFEKVSCFEIEPLQKRIVSKDSSLSFFLKKIYAEFNRKDDLSMLAIDSYFGELFVQLSRHSAAQVKEKYRLNLHEVQNVISSTYMNPMPLPQLAKLFYVHPVYLSKAFKGEFGLTISDYYRTCRVTAACHLLKESNLSIIEIAIDCGFYDQSHFSKYFRLLIGMPPLAYRNWSRKIKEN